EGTLASLGGAGGVPMVTAYGWANGAYCKALSWATAGTSEQVDIRCFAPGGAPIDTSFDLTFMRAADVFGFRPRTGYVHADQSTAANYVPAADKQYNSLGGANRVQRLATGGYEVVLPGLYASTGTDHVVVTATGNNTASCHVQN